MRIGGFTLGLEAHLDPAAYASISTKDLVTAQARSGRWPDPALLREVLKRGSEAVPLLNDIFSDDIYGNWPSDYAAKMLASLYVNGVDEAAEATPDLATFFETSSSDWLEDLGNYLSAFGERAIGPLIEILEEGLLDSFELGMTNRAAIMAAGDNPSAKAKVAETLRKKLASYVALGQADADASEPYIATLISDLADMRDAQARELVYEAYNLGLPDETIIGKDTYDGLMQQAAEPLGKFDATWLEQYERDYHKAVYDPDEDLFLDDDDDDDGDINDFADDIFDNSNFAELKAMVDRIVLERRMQNPNQQAIEIEAPKTKPVQPVQPVQPMEPPRAQTKLGRNDPCWCGSGKKYKHCHLREDEAKMK